MHLAALALQLFVLLLFAAPTLSHPSQHTADDPHQIDTRLTSRAPLSCKALLFRALSGRCTSPSNPSWGKINLPQFSYIPSSSSTIPTGRSLKSPREISNILCAQTSNTVNSHRLNLLFTFFGQFLDHNLALTPQNKQQPFNIQVPSNDPRLKIKTLPFVRSVRRRTGFGSAQRPVNALPSAVDLVAVYGSDAVRNAALRDVDATGALNGKLKVWHHAMMPLNSRKLKNSPNDHGQFFLAGDERANEHPMLTAMHTLFMREHNRLVDVINDRIPSLSGDLLYQYARVMNIAQFQKIVYEEFIPAIIARKLAPYRGFQRNVNPTVSDIFAGAAFRVGHTLVAMEMPRKGRGGKPLSPIRKNTMFFRPASMFSSEQLDNLVRGAAGTRAQEVDLKVVDLLRNFLFTKVKGMEGFDLVALNLQRGRDHALPKFNEIRALFGIPKAKSFAGITSNKDAASRLAKAYDSVDDVEAFVGMIGEDHAPGSGMGKTMEAVWRAEFARLRDGDQFFYLNTGKLPSALRDGLKAELQALRTKGGITFRSVILRNSGVTNGELPKGEVFKS